MGNTVPVPGLLLLRGGRPGAVDFVPDAAEGLPDGEREHVARGRRHELLRRGPGHVRAAPRQRAHRRPGRHREEFALEVDSRLKTDWKTYSDDAVQDFNFAC